MACYAYVIRRSAAESTCSPFTVDLAELREPTRHSKQEAVVGFGFLSRDNDYKVVRIVRRRKRRMVGHYEPNLPRLSINVLSLGSLTWSVRVVP